MSQIAELWEEYKRLYQDESVDDAEALYRSQIWPLLLQSWKEQDRIRGEFDVSIHTLGDSPEVVALSATALGADKVYVLYSERTEKYLGWLDAQLGKRVTGVKVKHNETTDIYQAVQRNVKDHASKKLAFDTTGGTKVMTSGLSAAAFVLLGLGFDAQVFYIDVRRERDEAFSKLSRPIPGSEELKELNNPLASFGDLEFHNAKWQYEQGNYTSAAKTFERIAEQTVNKHIYQVYTVLSNAYAAWYSNRFEEATKAFDQLFENLSKHHAYDHPLKQHRRTLEKQQEGVRLLSGLAEAYEDESQRVDALAQDELIFWLLSTLEAMQSRFAGQGNYTAAGLLCYRGLEVISQHRLAKYGFDSMEADYEPLPLSRDDLDKAYQQVWATFASKSQKKNPRPLPLPHEPVPLLEGYMLLDALGDELLKTVKGALGSLMGLAQRRNQSILVHGYKPISEEEHRKLNGLYGRLREGAVNLMSLDKGYQEVSANALSLD